MPIEEKSIFEKLLIARQVCKPEPIRFEINPKYFFEEIICSQNIFSSWANPQRTDEAPNGTILNVPIIFRPYLIGWQFVARNWKYYDLPITRGTEIWKGYPPRINGKSEDFDETEALKYEEGKERDRIRYEKRKSQYRHWRKPDV